MDNNIMLRAKNIAKAYDIGLSTVWLWSRKGLITPHKIGNITLFRKDEIEKLITGVEVGK